MKTKSLGIFGATLLLATFSVATFQNFSSGAKQLSLAQQSQLLAPTVFDWQAYLAYNPELMAQGIQDEASAQHHWLNSGSTAGRQASAVFDVKRYLAKNPDVAAQVAGDYQNAILHYMISGRLQGLNGTPLAQTYASTLPLTNRYGRNGDAVIGNQYIKVVTSSAYAGAISGLYYQADPANNMVNAGAQAYGRLFQIAGWKFGLGPCFNPIEAGSRYHDNAATGAWSSTLLLINASLASLSTSVVPALFRERIDPECASVSDPNGQLPSVGQTQDADTQFNKTITLNAFGDPRIMRVDVSVDSKVDVSGFVVQLYAALNTEYSQIYTVDLSPSGCRKGFPFTDAHCALIDRSTVADQAYSKFYPAILSKPDGSVAFAMYTASPNSVGAMPTFIGKPHLDGTANDVMDTSVNYAMPGIHAGVGAVKFSVYVIVGPLDGVRRKIISISRKQVPSVD